MVLQVIGSAPGLENAGVVWAGEFTSFLLKFWFTQSILSRRLFNKPGLLLISGTSVDD